MGANGSASYAQIFQSSELCECIETGQIGLPAAVPLPNDDRPMPFFIIGDVVFPLRTFSPSEHGDGRTDFQLSPFPCSQSF